MSRINGPNTITTHSCRIYVIHNNVYSTYVDHFSLSQLPDEKNALAKFVVIWNQIISHLRLEDLISNR